MELDDLKEKWRTASVQSPIDVNELLTKKLMEIETSGRGLRNVFVAEMVFVGVVYGLFLVMVWLASDMIMSFMYKLVGVTAVATVPTAWRLYKSQKWINSMDYTQDVQSNMAPFLKYFKATLWMYEWSTYVIILVLLGLLFTDSSFNALHPGVKITVVIYLIAVGLFSRPYIQKVYGRRLIVFENFLKE